MASRIASTLDLSRPSEKLGTHSTSAGISFEDNGIQKQSNSGSLDRPFWLRRLRLSATNNVWRYNFYYNAIDQSSQSNQLGTCLYNQLFIGCLLIYWMGYSPHYG